MVESISRKNFVKSNHCHKICSVSSKCSMLTHIQKCDCFHDIGSFQSIRLCWNVGKLPDGNHCHSQRIVVYTYQQKSTHPHMTKYTIVNGVKTFERKCWMSLLIPSADVRNVCYHLTSW